MNHWTSRGSWQIAILIMLAMVNCGGRSGAQEVSPAQRISADKVSARPRMVKKLVCVPKLTEAAWHKGRELGAAEFSANISSGIWSEEGQGGHDFGAIDIDRRCGRWPNNLRLDPSCKRAFSSRT